MQKVFANFSFRNSNVWIDYSHKRYLTLEEIRHRLKKNKQEFSDLKKTIESTRFVQALPFSIKSIDKLFWYFPSDSINKKCHQIENIGTKIFDHIERVDTYKEEFIKNATIEEAIMSAIYEGANSTRAKAKKLIAEEKQPKNKDEWMIVNNYLSMRWIKKNTNRAVDLDLIREIHEIVTKNTLVGDDANYIGKFRDDVVYVGETHEGVKYENIEESLREVISLTTDNQRYIHPIIRGILLHYFIGYVHPFFDGNGRTARTLFYFKAIKNKYKFVELLSISAHLKNHGKRYERAFENAVIHNGDMTYFVDFCLDSLLEAIKQVERKLKYLAAVAEHGQKLGLGGTQISLLQKMALNKFVSISIEEYSKSISRSREVARQELKELLKLQFLIEKKQGKKFVYFINSKKISEVISNKTK